MARVMLLGSDRNRAGGIRSILRQDGHQVAWVRSAEQWRQAEKRARPELIIAALPSAETVLGASGRPARGFPAPLLFVQQEGDFFRDVHLDDRLVDRIQSPFMSDEFLGRVDALVRARRVIRRTKTGDREIRGHGTRRPGRVLRRLGGRIAALLGTRLPRYEKPLSPYLEVAARIADWSDRRDVFEPGHAERVTTFSSMIAEGLGLPDGETRALLRAAMLHDIGKVALPVEVLRQQSPLRDEQRRLIRTHPDRGATLLRALDKDEQVVEAILYHHEQPDGEGYYGKSPGAIPRSAAILGVAEAYDAMTSTRLRGKLDSGKALGALRERRGQKYDAACVDALVEALGPRTTTIPLSGPSF